jgi:hypothetical protein
MSAGRGAARFSLRAAPALPTLVGFVWPLVWLAGAALGAACLMGWALRGSEAGRADLRLAQRERG